MAVSSATADVVAPTSAELHAALGKSASAWPGIICGLEERFSPLELQWRRSDLTFGRMCVVRHRGKVLVYLLPMAGQLLVGVVLEEQAYQIASVAAGLREAVKKMLRDCLPTAEGRGLRFVVKSEGDVDQVLILAECVMAGL